jgi:cyclase
MPIAAGGGIRSRDDAFALLGAGADKLVVNTPLFTSPGLVEELAATFGSQCLVGSIDYRRGPAGTTVYYGNGAVSAAMPVEEAVRLAEGLGVGEIYLTSIDKDGTGQGYDIEALRAVADSSSIPVIASGGVGDFDHFVAGMSLPNVNGASTANIFHFVGEGLREARDHLLGHGIELARWEAEFPAAPPRS